MQTIRTIGTIDDFVDAIYDQQDGNVTKVEINAIIRAFTGLLQDSLAGIRPNERIVLADLGVFSGTQRAARKPVAVSAKKTIPEIPPRTSVRWRAHARIRDAHKEA